MRPSSSCGVLGRRAMASDCLSQAVKSATRLSPARRGIEGKTFKLPTLSMASIGLLNFGCCFILLGGTLVILVVNLTLLLDLFLCNTRHFHRRRTAGEASAISIRASTVPADDSLKSPKQKMMQEQTVILAFLEMMEQ
ncbi:hypothetical protein KC360_g6 [Hortaea werneckii]|nr:hypothetical protein KC344_g6 [Hortaea werneckii]KAI7180375.1 hypothetical protein KC360_g6 [Hortaea werneckii]